MKKIKIKVNGKVKAVLNNSKLSDLLKNLNIPLKKVAIELNFFFATTNLSFFNYPPPIK